MFVEVTYINSAYSAISRAFKNNGYELAISDCAANRWPWAQTVARMDIPNTPNNGIALPELYSAVRSIQDDRVAEDFVIDIVDDANSLAVAGYPRFSVYSSKNGLITTEIPTVTIQTRNGSLGQNAVVKATGTKYFVSGTTGPYYYRFTGFEVVCAGYNYKRGTTSTLSIYNSITSTDYALITYTTYGTGVTTTAFAAVALGNNTGKQYTSALYPYRMKGLGGYELVPHVAAPVTIGLIKKISFE
jgi:hypothetical protein